MDNTQKIRLIDVFVLAPFLIYSGAVKSNLPVAIKVGLIISGVSTFMYNGSNFLKNIKK